MVVRSRRRRASFLGPAMALTALAVIVAPAVAGAVARGPRPSELPPGSPTADSSRPSSAAVPVLDRPTGAGPASPEWYPASVGLATAATLNGPPTSPGPPALEGAAMARDPNGSVAVLFGGSNGSRFHSAETWLYRDPPGRPASWTNVTRTYNGPPPLSFAAMAFDPDARQFVLFGGETPTGAASSATWFFNASDDVWTNATGTACASGCPTARYAASMAWAPSLPDTAVVLFGGSTAHGTGVLADTWALVLSSSGGPTLAGFQWLALAPSSAPSARAGATLAEYAGPAGIFLVLTGGAGSGGTVLASDTWEFYGGQWKNLSSSGQLTGEPAPRTGAAFEYDWAMATGLLSGGISPNGTARNDTVRFDCNATGACRWTAWSVAGGGPPRAWAASPGDTFDGEPLIVGGIPRTGSTPSADSWAFQNGTDFQLGLAPLLVELGQNVSGNASMSGGAVNGAATDALYLALSVTAPNGSVDRPPVAPPQFQLRFGAPGTWVVALIALDRWDVAASQTWAVTVGAPAVTATVGQNATDVGVPDEFVASPAGTVTPPLAYLWGFGTGPVSASDRFNYTFTTPGPYRATVELTDALRNSANATTNVSVHSRPVAAVRASSPSIPPGGSATFYASVTGGTAPIVFVWSFSDGTPSETGATATVDFGAPGTVTASVLVRDAVGVPATANVSINVTGPLSAQVRASATSVPVGVPLGFSASATGGSGEFSVGWLFGDGTAAQGADVTHVFAGPGPRLVSVWVNDSAGRSWRGSLNITVTGSVPGGGGGSAANPLEPLALGGLLAGWAAGGAAIAAVLWRRRRAGRPPDDGAGVEGPGTGTEGHEGPPPEWDDPPEPADPTAD